MNIHEYQGKAVLKEFGVPVSSRHARSWQASEARRGCRQGARRPGLGGEERRSMPAGAARAGSRRPRPARRAASGSRGRSTTSSSSRDRDAGPHPRHGPDRTSRQAPSTASISRRGRRSTASSTSPCPGRPRDLAAWRSWSRPRAAWISRRSRTTRPRSILTRSRSTPRPAYMPHHGRAVAQALEASPETSPSSAGEHRLSQALRGVPRPRTCRPAGDQSADRHQATAS